MIIQGILVSGTGKGSYFIRLYSSILEKELGFTPFPGTLNLKLKSIPALDEDKKIAIRKKGYGDVDCYPLLINNRFLHNHFKGYLIRPHKTIHQENIIEIIAPVHLRQELHVKDGDLVQCELE